MSCRPSSMVSAFGKLVMRVFLLCWYLVSSYHKLTLLTDMRISRIACLQFSCLFSSHVRLSVHTTFCCWSVFRSGCNRSDPAQVSSQPRYIRSAREKGKALLLVCLLFRRDCSRDSLPPRMRSTLLCPVVSSHRLQLQIRNCRSHLSSDDAVWVFVHWYWPVCGGICPSWDICCSRQSSAHWRWVLN